MLFAYHRNYGLDIGILRIFNTYGPRMRIDDGRVIPEFFKNAIKNTDIPIFGSRLQTRSLCYIDDLVDGVLLMMESNAIGPINLGNPDEISVIDLAKDIVTLLESSSNVTYKELMKDDPKQRKPDITLAKTILGWEPKIYRNRGLEKTLDYFKTKLNGL